MCVVCGCVAFHILFSFLSSFAATTMVFTNFFTRLLGVIFALIATFMLLRPQMHLLGDGIRFDTFPVCGKAEVRAYYFGTALTVSYLIFTSEQAVALHIISLVLGGFASARVLGYVQDGVDADDSLRLHQHVVFGLEVTGTLIALFLQRPLGASSNNKKAE